MADLGDLEKLVALRDAGTITAKEFELKKREILGGKKRSRGLWWKLPLLGIGVILINGVFNSRGSGPSTAAPSAVAAQRLPTCDSRETKQTIDDAIRNNASANVDTLRLLDWSNVQQVRESQTPVERVCSATLYLNSGQEVARFRMFYATPQSRNWMLNILEN